MAGTAFRSSEEIPEGAQLESAFGGADARSLALGLLAGALGSVPAVVRGLSAPDGLSAWGLVGLCALPMMVVAPVVLAARRSRRGQNVEPASSLLAELGVTLLLATAPLIWFAGWIAEHTHHRPLGAVTFAWIALALLAAVFIIARRLMRGGPRLLRLGCLGVMGTLGAYLLVQGSRAGFAGSWIWLDAVWLVVCAAAAVWRPRRNEAKVMPLAWRPAVLVWLFASCVGTLALLTNASEMTMVAPILTWPLR